MCLSLSNPITVLILVAFFPFLVLEATGERNEEKSLKPVRFKRFLSFGNNYDFLSAFSTCFASAMERRGGTALPTSKFLRERLPKNL